MMNAAFRKDMIRRVVIWICFLVCMVVTAFMQFAAPVKAQEPEPELDFFEMQHLDEKEEGYYTVKCEVEGDVLLRTARILHEGDEFIDVDNRYYQIVQVSEDVAWARLVEDSVATVPSLNQSLAQNEEPEDRILRTMRALQAEAGLFIGVLHSHGAESYVPSDGEESIEEGGGILQVGERFAESLENAGASVIHSDETHVPHDAGAYHRARRTKEELMKENPTALFDIHRDAVPEEEYLEEVSGEKRVQILLVVGRQNQNAESNREFAEGIKSTTDERFPGLIKGILMADGNYNQDMSPRSLLLEIGGHENQREDAEETADIFGEVVVEHLAGPGEGVNGAVAAREDTILGTGGTVARSILWLLGGLIFAVTAYLAIATGSWEEMKHKLQHFFRKEFADVRGGSGPKDDDDWDDNEW